MSLWVYVSSTKDDEQHRGRSGVFFDLEDNGYYWYMFPFFEKVHTSTGQMIDLYGNAKFSNQTLDILKEQIRMVQSSLKDMPDKWDVKIDERVISTVSKSTFLGLVEKFLYAIKKARKENKTLIFFGD